MTDSSPCTTICKISLADLTAFDQPAATPKHYRFLNCTSLVNDQHLHICEAEDLSGLSYSAVSYVWRGNAPDHFGQEGNTFHVEGATDGDPISITVLQHCNYLWLDRLCIMQTSREDKKWQIRNMYSIYKNCKVCLVLPAGLQHILSLQTETPWIHRSWTLQESLAPKTTFVLFSWNKGSGEILAGDEPDRIIEVISSQSAITTLSAIVNSCTVGHLEFQQHPADWNRRNGEKVGCQILGKETPNILALGAALNDTLATDPDSRESAIWQCALMRTSSRPVDMVFSIMGMFDVSLDPGLFDKDDRIQATIALAQEILRKGGRASWLGISLDMPLSDEISTFPQFPETTVEGKARVQTLAGKREVGEMMEGCYPVSTGLKAPLPEGKMDEQGYLTLTSMFALAVSETGSPDKNTNPNVFALIFGWFIKYYPGASLANDRNNIRGMLCQRHGSGKYHAISYFSLDRKWRSWAIALESREFCVGGPNPPVAARNRVGTYSCLGN
ncbi:hypothetical protein L218DRAFT_1059074 [Marasmius fiardii PR-910]|nr:hypothetical protein L218DRAFT_1059074 [Marasmius fiardii PR-910]